MEMKKITFNEIITKGECEKTLKDGLQNTYKMPDGERFIVEITREGASIEMYAPNGEYLTGWFERL